MIRTTIAACALFLAAACGDPDAAVPADAASAEAPPLPPAIGEPAPAPAGLEAFLRARNSDAGDLRYAFAPVDLDGDGAEEVLAYVVGPNVCGSGGCNLYVLTPDGDDWRTVTRTTVTQTPIGVLETSTGGWRDLVVSVGGGGMDAGWIKLAWDGDGYPENPTAVPAGGFEETAITTLIASDPVFAPLP